MFRIVFPKMTSIRKPAFVVQRVEAVAENARVPREIKTTFAELIQSRRFHGATPSSEPIEDVGFAQIRSFDNLRDQLRGRSARDLEGVP